MPDTQPPPLWVAMRQAADRDALPEDHPVRVRASELQTAVEMEASAQHVVGAWARAKTAYYKHLGKNPVDDFRPAIETAGKLLRVLTYGKTNR